MQSEVISLYKSGRDHWSLINSVINDQWSVINSYLKELNSYAGEHEIQKHGDQYDVTNTLNGNKYTLDDML